MRERRRGKKKRRAKLSPTIYGVLWVGFRRAKNKSSSHDERYTWVPEKRDFAEDPRGEISRNQSCRV